MPHVKLPPEQYMETAIMWLECNTGEAGESEACKAVAVWLQATMHDDMLRREARKGGVTVAALRRRIAQDRCGT